MDQHAETSLWQPPIRPVGDDVYLRLQGELDARLRDIAGRYDNVALASSLQAEDMVLLDASVRLGLPVQPFVIDTLRLHAETLTYLDDVERHYGLRMLRTAPEAPLVAAYEAQAGRYAFYDGRAERTACCALRKVGPLADALVGRDAWITGQRRAQSVTRTAVPTHEHDAQHGLAKFNPLADWQEDDVWHYVRAHSVPVHPLYARGFASIGCEPCTRAIRSSEDLRAGRWWWEDAASKECGLHVAHASPAAA